MAKQHLENKTSANRTKKDPRYKKLHDGIKNRTIVKWMQIWDIIPLEVLEADLGWTPMEAVMKHDLPGQISIDDVYALGNLINWDPTFLADMIFAHLENRYKIKSKPGKS